MEKVQSSIDLPEKRDKEKERAHLCSYAYTVCTAYLAQKPDIYLYICSNRDRLGFYAEIPIIFGTVYTSLFLGQCILIYGHFSNKERGEEGYVGLFPEWVELGQGEVAN